MKFTRSFWRSAGSILVFGLMAGAPAAANPALVVDAASGEVLYQDMAAAPWFPASLTKLMTTYVALSKAREGKITMNTPLRISAYAASMPPSKMGFRPGTLVTLDNALKMLMVKSPNDIAVTIAEGISGSVPAFADEMNAYAAKLGLRESHFVNPNGLPDPQHVSSARDMAMIGRALLREFPEDNDLFNIGALQFGGKIIPNHNGLLGRYPGIDGMKTGYTCSAGYNVVESATRGDKRLIAVILGAPSTNERNLKAVTLFEHFFGSPGSGLGDLASLPSSDIVVPPDLRGQICGPGRRNAIMEAEAEDAASGFAPAVAAPVATQLFGKAPEREDVLAMAAAPGTALSGPAALLHARDAFVPVKVFIGAAPGSSVASVGSVEAPAPGPKSASDATKASAAAVATAPDRGPASAAVDPGLPAPMALAGAVTSPALAAANKAVKSKGRMSLRVAGKAAAKPAAPARAATHKAVPVAPKPATKAKPVVKVKPSAKTANKHGKAAAR
jgi:D-alanyl-D-alanine carboxypeptidase